MKRPILFHLLLPVTLIVFCLALLSGRYPSPGITPPWEVLKDPVALLLIRDLRLPRVLSALLLGMVLGAGGTVFQMIFATPLVEPNFLGISQGAAFGAGVAILFLPASFFALQVSSTLFALMALFLSWFFARRLHFGGWILRLLLSGLAVAALFSSGVGVLKVVADPLSELPELTFWMLGGLWGVTWERILPVVPIVLSSLAILYAMRWRLNLLSFDDRVIHSLGALPVREKMFLLVASTVGVAAITSVSGIVGWVGLLIPGISRRLFAADGRVQLPGSLMLGGSFAMLCDTLSRTVTAGEIPLGVVTSLIGAFLFVVLLSTGDHRRR